LGTRVDPEEDAVKVDGTPIKVKRKLYIALNKPPGYICSRADPLNRRPASDLLPKEWSNLYSVGRLDYESEGLIFFTNDGDFSLKLTHPRYGVAKKYKVVVKAKVEPIHLDAMLNGIYHEGEKLKADKARLILSENTHSIVELTLKEGKKREIRRMFESQGFTVEKLQRFQIGPIKLAELPRGKWRSLTPPEIKSLTSGAF
jgi:23S rRNA pseudouridine2605 synthase